MGSDCRQSCTFGLHFAFSQSKYKYVQIETLTLWLEPGKCFAKICLFQGLVKGAILCFRNLYFYFWHGESTSTASQLTSPASQKSKDLNKVPLLLQDLGLVNPSVSLHFNLYVWYCGKVNCISRLLIRIKKTLNLNGQFYIASVYGILQHSSTLLIKV